MSGHLGQEAGEGYFANGLGLGQGQLTPAIAGLGRGLGGVGTPVLFEVQLAHPDRRIGHLRLRLGEERRRSLLADPGSALQISQPTARLQHLGGRAAASVAVPERVQREGGRVVIPEVGDGVGQVGDTHLPVVGVSRRKMGEYPRTVHALPHEAVMGPGVVLVPGQLLGQEPAHSGLVHELGQIA